MTSVDITVDNVQVVVSVDTPTIIVRAVGSPPGDGGGGGLDKPTADTYYIQKHGQITQAIEGALDVYGVLSPASVYSGGDLHSDTEVFGRRLRVFNNDRTVHGAQIQRTDPALSTDDPEIFAIYYGSSTGDNERASWANEKGQWRTSNIPAPGEDAFKIIGATDATGNMFVAVKQDGTIVARIGPNGTLIAETALRLVAGAANGRVLGGDASGNATWQPVPVATGAAPPAAPYTGQLWADPN